MKPCFSYDSKKISWRTQFREYSVDFSAPAPRAREKGRGGHGARCGRVKRGSTGMVAWWPATCDEQWHGAVHNRGSTGFGMWASGGLVREGASRRKWAAMKLGKGEAGWAAVAIWPMANRRRQTIFYFPNYFSNLQTILNSNQVWISNGSSLKNKI
jgi:hypothetical protein